MNQCINELVRKERGNDTATKEALETPALSEPSKNLKELLENYCLLTPQGVCLTKNCEYLLICLIIYL